MLQAVRGSSQYSLRVDALPFLCIMGKKKRHLVGLLFQTEVLYEAVCSTVPRPLFDRQFVKSVLVTEVRTMTFLFFSFLCKARELYPFTYFVPIGRLSCRV